jgi:hypothetical protein
LELQKISFRGVGNPARFKGIDFGGSSSRSEDMDGANPKALLLHWGSLQDDLQKANPDMARRLTEICDSHSDYVWEIAAQ